MFEGSLGYNYGKVLGSDEVIKLGYTDGKVFGTILGNVDGIPLGFDIGMLMVLMKASFRGYSFEIHWDLLMVKCLAPMKEPLKRT